ncbi:MAG: ATP-binding cassette domain-containing protein [Acetatifactor sp.]|nr:ATP-binding cassette domain-containing protein [Acetatifactor sp.]
MENRKIKVVGAKENNLKNINISIPQGIICGICGVSGSGKSTLAKDIIANSGIRNFSFSIPTYMRRTLYSGKRPDVIRVENLPPVYLIDIKNANKSVRSTVATASGLMSVLRNMFCVKYSNVEPRLFSYNILKKNGGGACEECLGTGSADTISEKAMFADDDKSIFQGGFSYVNEKGIKNTKITEKFLVAFCKENNINIHSAVCELSEKERHLLLYGSSKIIHFTDRSGANRGIKELPFPGICNALLDVYKRTKNERIAPSVIRARCSCCQGTRYNEKSLSYKLGGKNISEILSMSIIETVDFVDALQEKEMQDLKKEYLSIARELVGIGVGYLDLNRNISSVSGGEFQRIKLARCIALDVYNSCFILDEPSTGLHSSDIDKLIDIINKLKSKNNTVLIVEHNTQILRQCDYLIEMGELGGAKGGSVIYSGTIDNDLFQKTKTGAAIISKESKFSNTCEDIAEYIMLRNINVHNVHNENLKVPLGKFVTIVGVSGSGKSSVLNNALIPALNEYMSDHNENPDLEIVGEIDNVVSLSQDQSVANSRSMVGTVLDILDDIRDIFAGLPESKKKGYNRSYFTLNGGKGLCPQCEGSGIIQDEDNESEELCPVCGGKRFSADVLKIKYNGYNIADILSLELQRLLNIFPQEKINDVVQQCMEIGIGYLSLNRTTVSISKGEYQRIRIAKAISNTNNGKVLFILDEPSKGLHMSDIDCIVHSIKRLVEKGNTVIAIEHNLGVIAKSDYVIEFGPGAGNEGGKIIYSGTPGKITMSGTKTAEAFHKSCNKFETDRQRKVLMDEFKIPWNGIDVPIKLNKVNWIQGNIATGKSTIAKEILYGNPLKKYVSAINVQGKYITRDITARECETKGMPLARLVDVTERFYKKSERLMETLDFDYFVSNMFYEYGVVHCTRCGCAMEKVNVSERCRNCGAENHILIHKNAFAYGKKTCKCQVCNGNGRLSTYNFDKILADRNLYRMMMELLYDRTRISRIAPLLKEKYSIDISKKIEDMSDEEKRIFLYGDKKKEVLYKDKAKQKVYYWAGCNELIHTNFSYARDDFIKAVKETYIERTCPKCHGKGVPDLILGVSYKNIMYDDFVNRPISWVCEQMDLSAVKCEEEKILRNYLENILQIGLGHLHLAGHVSDTSVKERSIIQYLLYKLNPIENSIIVWDDFSAGKTEKDIAILVHDFEDTLEKGMTIVIFDGTLKAEITDCTLPQINKLKFNESVGKCIGGKYGCSVEEDNPEMAEDRLEMILYSRTSAATISETVSRIRTIFKAKDAKYSYSQQCDIEKCSVCGGMGFYDINIGALGMMKKICPDCNGTGFSKEINSVKVNDFSFSQLLYSDIQTVYDWLQKGEDKQTAENLKIFIDMGLGKIIYGKGLNELSYNECSLLLLIKYIKSTRNQEIWLKNMFIDIEKTAFESILHVLNAACIANKKKINIIGEYG